MILLHEGGAVEKRVHGDVVNMAEELLERTPNESIERSVRARAKASVSTVLRMIGLGTYTSC
jgi:hypothetical protein